MLSSEKKDFKEFLLFVLLPEKLKYSVRVLDNLSNLRAKELKANILYLSPIVPPSFSHSEDIIDEELDLKNLFSPFEKSLILLSSAISVPPSQTNFAEAWPIKQNELSQLHLLRYLTRQVKSFDPFFTASAALFESANRFLIVPLKGTDNQCQLLVKRFFLTKWLQKKTFEMAD